MKLRVELKLTKILKAMHSIWSLLARCYINQGAQFLKSTRSKSTEVFSISLVP